MDAARENPYAYGETEYGVENQWSAFRWPCHARRQGTLHGLLARAVLLDGESRARFNELVRVLNETLQPETAIDNLLIGKLAASHWRQIRIWNLEKEGEKGLGDHEMRLDRQFFRILDRYLKLKAFRRD